MSDRAGVGPTSTSGRWTFLTNHAHVLLTLYRNPDLRQRDVATLVGITEGAVQRIIDDLEASGYLEVDRVGRRNHYRVEPDGHLRHPLEDGHTVGELLTQLGPPLAVDPSTEHQRHTDGDRWWAVAEQRATTTKRPLMPL